jgi:hypothetical protein
MGGLNKILVLKQEKYRIQHDPDHDVNSPDRSSSLWPRRRSAGFPPPTPSAPCWSSAAITYKRHRRSLWLAVAITGERDDHLGSGGDHLLCGVITAGGRSPGLVVVITWEWRSHGMRWSPRSGDHPAGEITFCGSLNVIIIIAVFCTRYSFSGDRWDDDRSSVLVTGWAATFCWSCF